MGEDYERREGRPSLYYGEVVRGGRGRGGQDNVMEL